MSGFAALCGLCGRGGAAAGEGGAAAGGDGGSAAPGFARLRSLMDSTRLDQLKRPVQNVVILKDTATVDQALSVLAKHRILSAPVVRGAGGRRGGVPRGEDDDDDEDGLPPPDATLTRSVSGLPGHVTKAQAEAATAAAQWPQNQATCSVFAGPGGAGGAAASSQPQQQPGDATQQQVMASGGSASAAPGQLLGFLDIRDVLASFLLEIDEGDLEGAGGAAAGGAGPGSGNGSAKSGGSSSKKKLPDLRGMKMLAVMRVLEQRGAAWASATRIRDLAVFGGDGDFFAASQAGRATLRELIEYCLGSPGSSGLELHAAAPLAPASRSRAGSERSGAAAKAAAAAAGASSRGASQAGDDAGAAGPSTPAPAASTAAASGVVIHRVAVCDAGMRITNVVSQTDVVRYLQSHASALGPLAKKTAKELGWADRAVVVAPPELSALEAMRLMDSRHVSALAVVDSATRRIIGNFSISELRTICAEHFGSLALPVAEFLALENRTEFVGYRQHASEAAAVAASGSAAAKWTTDRKARGRGAESGAQGAPGTPTGAAAAAQHQREGKAPGGEVGQALVLARPEDTFLDVVGRLVKYGIHRVYVVDDDCKPVGVVTCSDILRAALFAVGSGK